MTLASMAMSAYGQIAQGRAAKKVAKSEAAAAEGTAKQQEFNAGVADAQAVDAVDRGEEDAARLREQVRGLVGAQRSGFAGQGVVVDTGSAADVQADTKTLGEADVRTIRHNAQRQAWGFRVEAENDRRNAAIARQGGVIALREGANAAKAGYLGAATTIVGGTSSLLAQRYGWRDTSTTSSPSAAARRTDALNRRTPPFQGDALPGYAGAS